MAKYILFSVGVTAALILGAIAVLKRAERDRYARHWAALSAIFVYLSLDEGARIHEMLAHPCRAMLGTSGLLYYAWIIPAALLVTILGCVYLRFLCHLPVRTRRLFITGGVIFVVGVFAGEAVGGWYAQRHGAANLVWSLIGSAEECCEMTGVAIFIYALLSYMADYHKRVLAISFRGVADLSRLARPEPAPGRAPVAPEEEGGLAVVARPDADGPG